MSEYTRQLVKQNGCEEVITVLQGRAEELELPERVDILVSEWMGNCLLVIMTMPILLLIIQVFPTLRSFISVLLNHIMLFHSQPHTPHLVSVSPSSGLV